MLIIEDSEKEKYTYFMEKIGCTMYKQSIINVGELQKVQPTLEKGDSKIIGDAVGQIVLDVVIELCKDMSKEDIIKYLAECSTQSMIMVINNNPIYKERIIKLINNKFV